MSNPGESLSDAPGGFVARIAVYDTYAAAPRVQDVTASTEGELIESLSAAVYSSVRDAGGSGPYTVLREIVENLIHADFQEIVISIMDSGSAIRFSDQGPGIADKQRVLLPGFTTATHLAKKYIRGVGSGLPIVNEYLEHSGGSLSIEDNLGSGTVVTLVLNGGDTIPPATTLGPDTTPQIDAFQPLSLRQKKVLSLVLEFGEVGPTLVSKELSVGLSTAYRDLAFLEESGLLRAEESGKRFITETGVAYLDALFD